MHVTSGLLLAKKDPTDSLWYALPIALWLLCLSETWGSVTAAPCTTPHAYRMPYRRNSWTHEKTTFICQCHQDQKYHRKYSIYLSQQGQRLESAPLAWRTVLIKLRCFSFHGGTFLFESRRDLLTRRGDDGTFGCCWGDDRLTLGTSGRSSSLCLAESNTLRFLVATFWQTFLCLSRDSTLKVLKHIGQGSRISCAGGSSSTALTTAVLGGGGGRVVVLGVSTAACFEKKRTHNEHDN